MPRVKASRPREIVTLADLAPRQDVRGGSVRRVFGADRVDPSYREGEMGTKKTKKAKDLAPKKGTVKGGGHNLNANITVIRATKPKVKKD